jgi:hypothetical protein
MLRRDEVQAGAGYVARQPAVVPASISMLIASDRFGHPAVVRSGWLLD